MSRQGFLKLKMYSVVGLTTKGVGCTVKVTASSTTIATHVDQIYQHHQQQFYLPICHKMQIELHNGQQAIGFFDLPIENIFCLPFKKHLITVNCITKDAIEGTLNPTLFGILTLSLMFMEGHVAKLDVLVGTLLLSQSKNEVAEREIFVECKINDILCKTTIKRQQEGRYEWKEHLCFTLEDMPHKLELLIKDRDLVNDEIIGMIQIDPQCEGMLATGPAKEGKYEFTDDSRKMMVSLRTVFAVPPRQ